jgi:hypothetical protein
VTTTVSVSAVVAVAVWVGAVVEVAVGPGSGVPPAGKSFKMNGRKRELSCTALARTVR